MSGIKLNKNFDEKGKIESECCKRDTDRSSQCWEMELNKNLTDHFVMQDSYISSKTEPDKTWDGSVNSNACSVGKNEVLFEDDLYDKK